MQLIIGHHRPDRLLLWRLRKQEWGFTILMLVMGVFFLSPPETFVLLPYSAITAFIRYFGLSASTGETLVGLVMLWVGLLGLLILVINGEIRRSPELRAGAATMRCLIWFGLAFGYWLSRSGSAAPYILGLIAIAEFTNIIDAALDRLASRQTGTTADQATTVMAHYGDGGPYSQVRARGSADAGNTV